MADTATFAEFYARYAHRLHGFVVAAYGAADADDVTQDAMLRAYTAYARLDPGRDPWPWLTTIARNVARNRHARCAAVPVADVERPAPDSTGDVEERHVVRAALRRLSPADRHVLVLREWHDYTFDELASLLGRSPNTLRQQALRARRRLADAYTALGGRAVGLACWLRRCWPVADAATTAVLAGVLALPGGPQAAVARPAPTAPQAAGPVARAGTHAGPAVWRAAPVRPLQPSRAARSSVPPLAAAPVPPARPPSADGAEVVVVGTHHARDIDRHDETVACAVAACYTIAGMHS